MGEKFDVTFAGRTVGQVEVKQEGLYCRLLCRCRVSDGQIHRLYADGEKLGVLIPDRGELVLETKVPAKRLKKGCVFSLEEKRGTFIPIRPGAPFDHLGKLRLAKLSFREGKPGVYLE